jgi:branched-chain amino acid aminotransferase
MENREGLIWFDGEFVDWKDANIHILNHGLHYASSVFEGERSYSGKIFKVKSIQKDYLSQRKHLILEFLTPLKKL